MNKINTNGFRIAEADPRDRDLGNSMVAQQQTLLSAGDNLRMVLEDNLCPQVTLKVLTNVFETFRQQFAYEEKLMSRRGYPGLDDHNWRHEDILNRLNRMMGLQESGARIELMKQADILLRDLKYHVGGADHSMTEFIQTFGNEQNRAKAYSELDMVPA